MNNTPQTNFNRYKKYSTDLKRYYNMPAVQTSLTVVLSFFVTAFFILVALRPTFVTIAKLKTTISDYEKTVEKLTAKATALQKISTASELYQPLIKFVDNSIPPDGVRYQSIATAMEILAFESQVTIVSQTVGESLTFSSILSPYTGDGRVVVETPFNVQVSGSFANINDFLQKLIALDRLFALDSVAFNREVKAKAKQEESPNSVSVTIGGKTTYVANKSQLSSVLPSLKEAGSGTSKTEEVSDVPEK